MPTTQKSTATEAAIFADLWDRGAAKLTAPVARYILKLQFSEEEQARVVDLVRRHQTGSLTAGEIDMMDNYLKAGDLLALLQSKARQFLKRHAAGRNGNG
jgi:hypothetical protein